MKSNNATAQQLLPQEPTPPPDPALYPDLSALTAASSELLGKRELQTRVDRKFLASPSQIAPFLASLQNDFHLLQAGNAGWASYETCYFDTANLVSFHEHLRGRRPRFKVRIRHHNARSRSFLEIKRKVNSGKTEKMRVERDFGQSELLTDDSGFIAQYTPASFVSLRPSVWTNFHRATLLGANHNERLTIDMGLHFVRGSRIWHCKKLAIVEIKQERLNHRTPSVRALRELGIREQSVSKYCTGVASLHEAARPRAKQTMRRRLERVL